MQIGISEADLTRYAEWPQRLRNNIGGRTVQTDDVSAQAQVIPVIEALVAEVKRLRNSIAPNERGRVNEFLQDRCERVQGGEVKASVLFIRYQQWCQEHGLTSYERFGPRLFGEAMMRRFVRTHRVTGNIYIGVQLKGEGS